MAYDHPDITSLLTLEPHGPDTFVGTGPEYPWGKRVYGGQVVAQALRAAASTVDGPYRAHSLHAYFIRPGDADEPIRFEVDRLRNGRSFVTRRQNQQRQPRNECQGDHTTPHQVCRIAAKMRTPQELKERSAEDQREIR